MNQIFIKHNEYNDYQARVGKKNMVLEFWLKICKSMPTELIKELRTKPTNLVMSKNSQVNTGVKAYQFVTSEASSNLKEILNKYVVFVETDTSYRVEEREVQNLVS